MTLKYYCIIIPLWRGLRWDSLDLLIESSRLWLRLRFLVQWGSPSSFNGGFFDIVDPVYTVSETNKNMKLFVSFLLYKLPTQATEYHISLYGLLTAKSAKLDCHDNFYMVYILRIQKILFLICFKFKKCWKLGNIITCMITWQYTVLS